MDLVRVTAEVSAAAFDREFSQAVEVTVRVVVRELVSDQEAEGSITFTVEASVVVTVLAQVTSPLAGVPDRTFLELVGILELTFHQEDGRVEGRLTVESLSSGPGRFSLGGPSVSCDFRNRTSAKLIGTFEPIDTGGEFSGTASGTTTLIDFPKDICDDVVPNNNFTIGQTSEFGPFSWRATVIGGIIISSDFPELAWEFSVAFPAAE